MNIHSATRPAGISVGAPPQTFSSRTEGPVANFWSATQELTRLSPDEFAAGFRQAHRTAMAAILEAYEINDKTVAIGQLIELMHASVDTVARIRSSDARVKAFAVLFEMAPWMEHFRKNFDRDGDLWDRANEDLEKSVQNVPNGSGLQGLKEYVFYFHACTWRPTLGAAQLWEAATWALRNIAELPHTQGEWWSGLLIEALAGLMIKKAADGTGWDGDEYSAHSGKVLSFALSAIDNHMRELGHERSAEVRQICANVLGQLDPVACFSHLAARLIQKRGDMDGFEEDFEKLYKAAVDTIEMANLPDVEKSSLLADLQREKANLAAAQNPQKKTAIDAATALTDSQIGEVRGRIDREVAHALAAATANVKGAQGPATAFLDAAKTARQVHSDGSDKFLSKVVNEYAGRRRSILASGLPPVTVLAQLEALESAAAGFVQTLASEGHPGAAAMAGPIFATHAETKDKLPEIKKNALAQAAEEAQARAAQQARDDALRTSILIEQAGHHASRAQEAAERARIAAVRAAESAGAAVAAVGAVGPARDLALAQKTHKDIDRMVRTVRNVVTGKWGVEFNEGNVVPKPADVKNKLGDLAEAAAKVIDRPNFAQDGYLLDPAMREDEYVRFANELVSSTNGMPGRWAIIARPLNWLTKHMVETGLPTDGLPQVPTR